MDFLPPPKQKVIDSWFLMGSPVPLLVIFGLYFSFLKIGPMMMKNRKPFDLKVIIRIYNLIQVAACSTFVIQAYRLDYNVFKATWKCMKFEEHFNYKNVSISDFFGLYWYFMLLRTAELLETVFFILRKKERQVSFLHVYHHVSTITLLYIMNRYSASMMELYIAMLNNCVHILMYAYYFASSFESATKYVKALKPIMTTIQIGQLILILGQCLKARACGSSSLFYAFAVNLVILIFFFGKFYAENYMKKSKKVQ